MWIEKGFKIILISWLKGLVRQFSQPTIGLTVLFIDSIERRKYFLLWDNQRISLFGVVKAIPNHFILIPSFVTILW